VMLVAVLAAPGVAGDGLGERAAVTVAMTVAGVVGLGAFLVGRNAQTPGQWFWGLMTVSAEGRELFYGQAYRFVWFNLLLGWLTPLVQPLSPDRRGPTEWLAGARVIRIRLCHDAILKV
ncbi:MAG: RDD family protein, partial [bacterium]